MCSQIPSQVTDTATLYYDASRSKQKPEKRESREGERGRRQQRQEDSFFFDRFAVYML